MGVSPPENNLSIPGPKNNLEFHVLLSLLSGFFISLSFLMNKRVMDLYRARVGDIINSACNTGREKSPSVLVLTSATQDTKL